MRSLGSSGFASEQLGKWALIAAIVGSALAVGAIHPIVLSSIAAVSLVGLVAMVAMWRESTVGPPRRAATLIVIVLVALTALTAVQCMPLSLSTVRFLSPHAADVWARALRPFGEAPSPRVTLSLDPSSTRLEVLQHGTYLVVFLLAWRVARNGAVDVQRALILASSLVLVVAATHYALDLRSVYGIYSPRTTVTTISPFLNGNHLSAYGNIGLILAFAAFFSSRPLFPRALLAAVILAAVGADIFWASRGAVASAAVGMILVVAFRTRDRARQTFNIVLPFGIALAGCVMLMLGSSAFVRRELSDTDVSKFSVARRVLYDMVPRYLWFGAGRGAFESTFPEFRDERGFLVWTHPENIVAEWLSGWGVFAGLAIIVLAYALRPQSVVTRRAVGPWVVVVVIFLHNLVDFSLEIPAMAIAVVTCMALVASGRAIAQQTGPRSGLILLVGVACAVCLTITGIGLTLTRGNDLLTDKELIRASLRADDRALTMERVHAAMAAHPAEPYFAYAGAVVQGRQATGNVLPWIEHTLERAPVYAPAHLVLARWLRTRSPSQSRLEYRIYAEQSSGPPVDVEEIRTLVHSYDDALEVATRGTQGVGLLDALSIAIGARLPATASRIDREILERDPKAAGASMRLAEAGLADLSEPWCAISECGSAATAAAWNAERVSPTRCEPYVTHARILSALGDAIGAIKILVTADDVVTDASKCDEARAVLAIDAHRDADATLALDALMAGPCANTEACVDKLLLVARLELRRGGKARAAIALRRAATLDASDDSLEHVASVAAAIGIHDQAAKIYEGLEIAHPSESRWRRLAADQKALSLP